MAATFSISATSLEPREREGGSYWNERDEGKRI
jgi:hypothetical protein